MLRSDFYELPRLRALISSSVVQDRVVHWRLEESYLILIEVEKSDSKNSSDSSEFESDPI
jgi:hypothetical protein